MRNLLTIALTDLSILFRQRSVVLTTFLVPIGLTIALGFAFGGGGSSVAGEIDVVRTDPNDALARQFVDLLRAESGTQYVVCDLSDPANQPTACGLDPNALPAGADLQALAQKRIMKAPGVPPVAAVIPANFSADLQAGKSVPINYLVAAGLSAPTLAQQKVEAVLTRLNGTLLAARVVTDKAAPTANQQAAVYNGVYQSAASLWAANPVTLDEQVIGGQATQTQTANGFAQSAPGMGAMYALSSVLGLAALFVTQRQEWTLQRLMMMPMPRWQILAGKLLGRFVLGLIVYAVMIAVGTAFGVQWGNLPGLILVVLAYTLAVTAIALLVATMVSSQQQVTGITLLLTLTLPPLGGAWWPLNIVPDWMQTIGHLSPVAWSQDAFNTLVIHHGVLLDVLPDIGVLLVFAAIFFVIGLSRFRYV